jgi:hypothetical protein
VNQKLQIKRKRKERVLKLKVIIVEILMNQKKSKRIKNQRSKLPPNKKMIKLMISLHF